MSRLVTGLFAALAVQACTPEKSIRGTVRSVPPACGSREQGATLAGAELSLACRRTKGPPFAISDASGQVHWVGVGKYWFRECWIRVSKAGYRDQLFSIADLCRGEGECRFIAVVADLPPVP